MSTMPMRGSSGQLRQGEQCCGPQRTPSTASAAAASAIRSATSGWSDIRWRKSRRRRCNAGTRLCSRNELSQSASLGRLDFMSANVEIFAGHRDRLFGIAYRMLGSRADAEDVLQDAWLRWHEQDTAELRSTEAWLTTMVTRLAIDRLRAAKTQRATYFGPWLPEPLAEAEVPTPESHA